MADPDLQWLLAHAAVVVFLAAVFEAEFVVWLLALVGVRYGVSHSELFLLAVAGNVAGICWFAVLHRAHPHVAAETALRLLRLRTRAADWQWPVALIVVGACVVSAVFVGSGYLVGRLLGAHTDSLGLEAGFAIGLLLYAELAWRGLRRMRWRSTRASG